MRFRLTLHNPTSNTPLTFNYNYLVMAWIYGRLKIADEAYASFLHSEGYTSNGTKTGFKYFTFSPIFFGEGKRNYSVDKRNSCMIIHTDRLYLDLSFYVDKAAENFIIGVFRNQTLSIYNNRHRAEFSIANISTLEKPVFESKMNFIASSPMNIGLVADDGVKYIAPDHEDFARLFTSNLASKYNAIRGKDLAAESIQFKLISNSKYIKSRLITIKEKSKEETKIKGFYNFSFELIAPAEVIELGYYGGFGKFCSEGMGFTNQTKTTF